MEDRIPVEFGGGNGLREIRDYEAAALEHGFPGLFFPLTGYDGRKGAVGWIDRQGMVPLCEAGELSAVNALGILEQLVYGMYEDMDLCLLPEDCRLSVDDIYVDTATWKVRAVFRPAAESDAACDPASAIRRKAALAASGMLRSAEIGARGYLERAVRILNRDDMSLDRAVSGLEALKRRAFRLSDPEGSKLDFGNVFV
ncbi:MAG: hypothetical protein IKG59_05310 [Firmicutes bacterium]|nr:hypothetical protein [Bacillota bacterium]